MGVVVAVSDGWVSAAVKVVRGQLWSDDDPVVLAHPGAFVAADAAEAAGLVRRSGPAPVSDASGAVEDASAAPGELRHVVPAGKATRRG